MLARDNHLLMIRSLLEKATRRSTFRRTLPAGMGGAPIYVSGSAGLKYLFRPMESIDPGLCALAREFVSAGHTVWDVGANVGLFTFAAAHLAGARGKVIAFEPDVWLVQLLRHSAAIQPPSSAEVQIVPAAVAQSCDLRSFHIAVRSRATNALAGYGHHTGGVAERQTVVTASLDWLAERLPSPDVVKIDVEGAELEVLRGAIGLMQKKGPIFLCEVSADRAREVTQLLKDLRYRIYDGDSDGGARREVDVAPWSTVAVRS